MKDGVCERHVISAIEATRLAQRDKDGGDSADDTEIPACSV